MQAWRDMAVREKLARDETSANYLHRGHFTVAKTGFATVEQAAAEGSRKRGKGRSLSLCEG